MAITITLPTAEFRSEVVEKIIGATAREVTFQHVTGTGPCLVCSGVNPFCTTCNGQPSVEYIGETSKLGTVRWGPSEKKIYRPEGQYVEGDCLVILPVSLEDEIDPIDLLLAATRKVIVDGRTCIISKWYYRGSPLNRAYIVLNEDSLDSVTRVG